MEKNAADKHDRGQEKRSTFKKNGQGQPLGESDLEAKHGEGKEASVCMF